MATSFKVHRDAATGDMTARHPRTGEAITLKAMDQLGMSELEIRQWFMSAFALADEKANGAAEPEPEMTRDQIVRRMLQDLSADEQIEIDQCVVIALTPTGQLATVHANVDHLSNLLGLLEMAKHKFNMDYYGVKADDGD